MSKIIKYVVIHDNPKLISAPQPCIIKPVSLSPNIAASGEEIETIKATEAAREDILNSAKLEAQSILSQAAEEVARHLAEASEAAEQMKMEAQQEGFQAGYAEGLEQGRQAGLQNASAHLEQARLQAQQIIGEAKRTAQETLYSAEKDIIDIALTIARKILMREIDENPMTLLPIVREALGKIQDQEKITIRVNPNDLELINHAKRDLHQIVGGERNMSIVSDHTITSGGCIIETKNGTVDASIDTQFEIIKKALLDVVP